VLAGLPDDRVEDPLVEVHPQAAAEVGQQAGVGQRAVEAEPQEQAEGHVGAGLLDGLAVGEVVVVLEELQLQQQQRLQGGAAAVGVVGVGQQGAAAVEVNGPQDAAEVMVGRYGGVEDELVEFGGGLVGGGLQHKVEGASGHKGCHGVLPSL
jgi:hypothetical protein